MKHINLKKLAGLTAAAALSLSATAALADTADSALVRGGSLNLRQTPSLSAKVLGQFPTGTLVEIVEAGSEWHKVEVGGKSGYMMAKYLKITDDEMIVKPFQAKVINVNGGSYVNFRKAASLSAGIIDRIDVGSTVTVIEHGVDWCKVIADGVEGYMSTWFLRW